MKVAITGATGFIGRHILKELSMHGVDITAICRTHFNNQALFPAVKFIQLDLQNVSPGTFSELGNPDIVIHLAWEGLQDYKSSQHMEQQLPMHFKFLHSLISSGLETLVVAGTCFEYGMQSGSLAETAEPKPATPYGSAKNILRQQLVAMKRQHPFNLIWPRLFYLHGEGQAANSLFPQLQQAANNGEALFNMSGGKQLRDYLPVETAAKMIVQVALQQKDTGIINICSGKPISVHQLVVKWIQENNWSIAPNLGYYPYPDYEPMEFWGDNSKLSAVLGGNA